ncbi:MarR family winged helix-turn-helix transcriptional regulator [Actinomycetospora callitridis]|uniref:MarR family winged helix-turn-helix transcriptional regulator n=1 Tax=Actinomycetospora callitridis TaxID=913944 RepID=UPI002365B606|nr:MarR family transcriptional regulator [Actinomycetospora callitridis]MDD7917407.1 MarR family transcriptional regulator [Actinomycetospora callitridis]
MTEGPWLDDDEQRAWRRTAAVMTLLPAALDAQLQRDAGLTQFSYLTLAMLSETPGRTLPMSALAATVNSSLSRLSHVVARLEQQGWVVREPSPDSGRVTVARLTDAGMEKVRETAPGHAAEVRRLIFDALDCDGVESLACVAAAILGRLDPSGGMRANPLSQEAPRASGDRRATG